MEGWLANMLRVRGSLTRVARWGRSFAENEELDEGANQENDRKLTDEKALREGQLGHHSGISDLGFEQVSSGFDAPVPPDDTTLLHSLGKEQNI